MVLNKIRIRIITFAVGKNKETILKNDRLQPNTISLFCNR